MSESMHVKFVETDQRLPVQFKGIVNVSDGGYERGYAAGYEDGNAEGYIKGHTDGVEQGYADGYEVGEASRYAVEDALVSKTLTEYRNPRPIVIGNRFFSYCYDLAVVDIPSAVSIGDYAFVYCNALTEIVLPSVTSIAAFAFQNCPALTKVDLHKVTSLQSNTFTNTNLTTLILRRTDGITSCGSTAVFNNTPISKGTGYIYVPAELVEEYKAATNWKTYAAQIRAIEDYPEITT